MSLSQFKNWVRALGGCEARSFAQYVIGDYDEPGDKIALLLGNLAHKIVLEPDSVTAFEHEHRKAFFSYGDCKKGYKSDVLKAVDAAHRIANCNVFTKYLDKDKEVPLVFDLGGIIWRSKLDACGPDYFTDLKFVKGFDDEWSKFYGKRVQWYKIHHYNMQFAVYAEAFEKNFGTYPKVVMIGASKESPCNFDVKVFKEAYLKTYLETVIFFLPGVIEVKAGEREPERCGKCHYCRSTVLSHIKIEEVDV